MPGYRCEDGRLMRHTPMPDDPELETDIGPCPNCLGKGCYREFVRATHHENCPIGAPHCTICCDLIRMKGKF